MPPAILAAMLTESEVLKQADATQKEIEDAWAIEIEKRATAYDRGETQAIDGREAIDRMRFFFTPRFEDNSGAARGR